MNGIWFRLSGLRNRISTLSKTKKLLLGAGTATAVVFGVGYYTNRLNSGTKFRNVQYAHLSRHEQHTHYPPSVARRLKYAIWDESDKGDHKYEKALKQYIQALNKLDELEFDKLDDDYTRLELKIAEMYEKIGRPEASKDIYLEVLHRYYDALNTPRKVPDRLRPEMIRKDLRLLIKSLELNTDLELGKRNLLAHLLLAQEEIFMRSPELEKFFNEKREKAGKTKKGGPIDVSEFKTFVDSEHITLDKDGYMVLNLQKNSGAWEPFKEEFFTARDLYTAYCLSSNDIPSALSCKMTTVEWMVMADMPPGQILLAQANLGSLLYLQAEKFKADIEQIEEKCEKKPELSKDSNVLKALRILHRNTDSCLNMAGQCYDSIVKFSRENKKLRYHLKKELDPAIAQAIALSLYGKGVLTLQEGSLEEARRLLSEAGNMAREVDFAELLREGENELERVKDEIKNTPAVAPTTLNTVSNDEN